MRLWNNLFRLNGFESYKKFMWEKMIAAPRVTSNITHSPIDQLP